MFEYDICNVFDKKIFNKQCIAIEKHIPNLRKESLLEDVDGSQLQVYTFDNGSVIKVENDVMLGVIVKSDVMIEDFFS